MRSVLFLRRKIDRKPNMLSWPDLEEDPALVLGYLHKLVGREDERLNAFSTQPWEIYFPCPPPPFFSPTQELSGYLEGLLLGDTPPISLLLWECISTTCLYASSTSTQRSAFICAFPNSTRLTWFQCPQCCAKQQKNWKSRSKFSIAV